MTRLIAAALLFMAAACSREAPVENKPAAAAPAPTPPLPSPSAPTNTANAAAIATLPEMPNVADAEPAAPAEQADGKPDPTDEQTVEADEPDAPPLRGCAREVGEERAQRLVRQCLIVSTATHPPCNAENSCAMIRSEIDRGCSMAGEDAPRFCR